MDITPSLIAEIVGQCQKKGFVVSPQLAATFAKSLLLAEPKDETGTIEVQPETVEDVVTTSVTSLSKSDSPVLESFKMQASILVQQQETTNSIRTELVQHRAKSQQLKHEACSKVDHNKVFGDIVLYILHETGLFATRNELVQKETMTALESVIPRSSIESLISQPEHEKVKQLEELWKIVWGIRLFNRETHKGGSGISDLPNELTNAVQTSQATLLQQQENMQKQCTNYLTVLRFLSKEEIGEGQWLRLNEEYCNRRQFLQFVQMLLGLVEKVSKGLGSARPIYESLVSQIKELVQNSNSVPKSLIYPRFIDLSEKWETFKTLSTDMKGLQRLLNLLLAFQNSFSPTLKPMWVEKGISAKAENELPMPNQLLLEQETNTRGKNTGCSYVPILPVGGSAEFNGFCVPSVLHMGILMEAVPEVGYVLYGGKHYGFSDEGAVKAFVSEPDSYIKRMPGEPCLVDLALVHLLGLSDQFPTGIFLSGTRDLHASKKAAKSDADAQTGQIDPYKDYKYEWNEWELRRLALKLANLRNKRTKSCQTHLSHFRSDEVSQTYPKRDGGTQTLVDSATQPQRTVQYVKGLRGHEETRTETVQMTFDE